MGHPPFQHEFWTSTPFPDEISNSKTLKRSHSLLNEDEATYNIRSTCRLEPEIVDRGV